MAAEITRPGRVPAGVMLSGECKRCGCRVRLPWQESLASAHGPATPCPTPGCGWLIGVRTGEEGASVELREGK